MKALYRMCWDFGRMGDLTGLFIADTSEIDDLAGKTIYFGEVLGKHSDIYGEFDESCVSILTEDQDFIAKFKDIVGPGTICGYNPLKYIDEE